MVIAGRLLAAELASAWSSRGSGFRRLLRAWASILLARVSMLAEEADMSGDWRGSGIRWNEASCVVDTECYVELCMTIGRVEMLGNGVRN